MELGRIVMSDESSKLINSKDIQEFYLGQNNEPSERGQKRWKQKKTWR
jgi:branched-chain amino acid transport system ATP-binding protein